MSIFENLPDLPSLTEEATPAKKAAKTYQLDMFKQTLPALYKCDFDFYARCDEDQQKEITPFLLLRWVSLAQGHQAVAPEFINEFVNQGFWGLYKHPELQWKMLCAIASEISPRTPHHKWLKVPKYRSKTPRLDEFLLQKYPGISNAELDILRNKMTEEKVKSFIRAFGESDGTIKEIVKEFKSYNDGGKKKK